MPFIETAAREFINIDQIHSVYVSRSYQAGRWEVKARLLVPIPAATYSDTKRDPVLTVFNLAEGDQDEAEQMLRDYVQTNLNR